VRWPSRAGRGLGPAGAWNLLWRVGCRPFEARPGRRPDAGDVLFVCVPPPVSESTIAFVRQWLTDGGVVVATTPDMAWGMFLAHSRLLPAESDYPYAALACLLPGRPPDLLAPPRWPFVKVEGVGAAASSGTLALVHGERQTPGRALVTAVPEAPARLRQGRFLFLNGDPFSAFQAWLQGQEPLDSWLAWRHRLFWLDEHAAWLTRVLEDEGVIPSAENRTGVPGLGETTVVLRHDLDESRDTSYLDEEVARGLTGVHCVLRDRNTRFWVDLLSGRREQEMAFHYSTLTRPSAVARLTARLDGEPLALRPSRPAVAGRGLLDQVRWAKGHGIGTATLHRHGGFLFYPEWVDALDAVLDAEPEVLGGSSLFRGQVLRWDHDGFVPEAGSVGDFPDAQFPLWLPFRLAHAGREGRMLRGWETASIMESEPALVEQMLKHRIPGLRQRVLTLGYHPAHARRPTFRAEGSAAWFRDVLELVRENGAEVRTLRDVYHACDEAVRLESSGR